MSLGMDVGASASLGAVMSRIEFLEARLSQVEDVAQSGADLAPYGPGGFGISEGGGGAGIQPFTIVSEESSDSEGNSVPVLYAAYCWFVFGRHVIRAGSYRRMKSGLVDWHVLRFPAGAANHDVALRVPHANPASAELVLSSTDGGGDLTYTRILLYHIASDGSVQYDYRGMPTVVVRE